MMPQLNTRPSSLPHIQISSAKQQKRLPLLCIGASAGLATIIRGSIDKDALALFLGKVMNLRDNQGIIQAQKVGWLKEYFLIIKDRLLSMLSICYDVNNLCYTKRGGLI